MAQRKGPPIPAFLMMQMGRRLRSEPFLDSRKMEDGPCDCSGFQQPHLRRCAFDPSTISFLGRINAETTPWPYSGGLDGGADGYNWKARFGDSQDFVLKIVSRSCRETAGTCANIYSSGAQKHRSHHNITLLSGNAKMLRSSR